MNISLAGFGKEANQCHLNFGHIILVYLQHLVDFENLKERDLLEDFGLHGMIIHFN
jgi:hypothetical protein